MAQATVLFLLLSTTVLQVAAEKDCLIDEKKGWEDPDNVYPCKGKDEKCCIEATKPSCCTDKNISVEVLEQVKLWGGLIGSLVLIGIIVLCYRREKSCCGNNDEQGGCCCCCKGKKNKDDDDVKMLTAMPPSPDEIKKTPIV